MADEIKILEYNSRNQFNGGLIELNNNYYAKAEIIESDGTKRELIASFDHRFMNYEKASIQRIHFNREDGRFSIELTDEFRDYLSRLYEALGRIGNKFFSLRLRINNEWYTAINFENQTNQDVKDYHYNNNFKYIDYFGSFENFAKEGTLQFELQGLIEPYDSGAGFLLANHSYGSYPIERFSSSGSDISEANISGFGSGTIRITTKSATYEKSFEACSFDIGVPIPYTGTPSNSTYSISISGPDMNWYKECRNTSSSDVITSYSINVTYVNSSELQSRECNMS